MPAAVIVPGVLLLVVGSLMGGESDLRFVGLLCAVSGLALLITGTVARGVAWGLAIHEAAIEARRLQALAAERKAAAAGD
jgi:hypothetical protein